MFQAVYGAYIYISCLLSEGMVDQSDLESHLLEQIMEPHQGWWSRQVGKLERLVQRHPFLSGTLLAVPYMTAMLAFLYDQDQAVGELCQALDMPQRTSLLADLLKPYWLSVPVFSIGGGLILKNAVYRRLAKKLAPTPPHHTPSRKEKALYQGIPLAALAVAFFAEGKLLIDLYQFMEQASDPHLGALAEQAASATMKKNALFLPFLYGMTKIFGETLSRKRLPPFRAGTKPLTNTALTVLDLVPWLRHQTWYLNGTRKLRKKSVAHLLAKKYEMPPETLHVAALLEHSPYVHYRMVEEIAERLRQSQEAVPSDKAYLPYAHLPAVLAAAAQETKPTTLFYHCMLFMKDYPELARCMLEQLERNHPNSFPVQATAALVRSAYDLPIPEKQAGFLQQTIEQGATTRIEGSEKSVLLYFDGEVGRILKKSSQGFREQLERENKIHRALLNANKGVFGEQTILYQNNRSHHYAISIVLEGATLREQLSKNSNHHALLNTAADKLTTYQCVVDSAIEEPLPAFLPWKALRSRAFGSKPHDKGSRLPYSAAAKSLVAELASRWERIADQQELRAQHGDASSTNIICGDYDAYAIIDQHLKKAPAGMLDLPTLLSEAESTLSLEEKIGMHQTRYEVPVEATRIGLLTAQLCETGAWMGHHGAPLPEDSRREILATSTPLSLHALVSTYLNKV